MTEPIHMTPPGSHINSPVHSPSSTHDGSSSNPASPDCAEIIISQRLRSVPRIMIFGKPLSKQLSDSSVCYWRNRKQADNDLTGVKILFQ